MKLKGKIGGVYEYEIKPISKTESFYWLLFLNDVKAYIPKMIFKHNKKGDMRINIYIQNINSASVMNDVRLKVITEMNK